MTSSKQDRASRLRSPGLKLLVMAVVIFCLYVLTFFGFRKYSFITDMNSQGDLVSFKGFYFTTSEKSNHILHDLYRPLWKWLLGSRASNEFQSINALVDHAGRNGGIYLYDIEMVQNKKNQKP